MGFLQLVGSTADLLLSTYAEWEKRILPLGVSYRMLILLHYTLFPRQPE